MFNLNKNGYITGYDAEPFRGLAPKPCNETQWSENHWAYNYKPFILGKIKKKFEQTSHQSSLSFLMGLMNKVIPLGGRETKEKDKNITILITSYKKHLYLDEAIQSCLNQTLKPYDVLVLAMTDEDYNVAVKYPVSVILHERLDVNLARNFLVEQCKTEYFVHLDADDTLSPNFLQVSYQDRSSIVFPVRSHSSLSQTNLTSLLHKEVWSELGGLSSDLTKGAEDIDFIYRLLEQGKWRVACRPEIDYMYRELPDSLFSSTDFYSYYFKVCKSLFKRNPQLLDNTELLPYKQELTEFFNTEGQGYFAITKALSGASLVVQCPLPEELIYESFNRESSHVCLDESRPELYQRAFDLYLYSYPIKGYLPKSGFYYVNNPEIDVSLPLEEIMRQYNVVFSTQVYEHIIPILDSLELSPAYKEPLPTYNLLLNKTCNKKCTYCNQSKLEQHHHDDNFWITNFDLVLDKLESLHGHNWMPNLCGGEVTLLSDNVQRHIVERLWHYKHVTILTNGHSVRESVLYELPSIAPVVHLMNLDDIKEDMCEASVFIVTRDNLNSVLVWLQDEHSARVKRLLTLVPCTNSGSLDLDRTEHYMLDLAAQLSGITTLPVIYHGRTKDTCLKCFEVGGQVDVENLVVYPCCNYEEDVYPLDEWNRQEPSGKHCSKCNILMSYKDSHLLDVKYINEPNPEYPNVRILQSEK